MSGRSLGTMELTEVQELLGKMEEKFTEKLAAMQKEFDGKLKYEEDKYILLLDQQTKMFKTWMDSGKESTENNTLTLGKMCEKIGELENQIKTFTNKKASDHDSLIHEPFDKATSGHTQSRVESVENALYDLEAKVKACEKQIDSIEDQSRRNNIKFFGIEQTKEWETWEDSENLIRELMKSKLKLSNADDIRITRAHRLAKGSKQKKDDPRPLIVKFDFFSDRQAVLRASSLLKPFNIFVSEDFCTRTSDYRNNVLKPQMLAARDAGKYAVMRHRKLIVKEKQDKPNSDLTDNSNETD